MMVYLKDWCSEEMNIKWWEKIYAMAINQKIHGKAVIRSYIPKVFSRDKCDISSMRKIQPS